ncbi:unnamed protein product [Amoebophrya sp. A120]|nr:unnamed protein product [Amoebophrya sp. A120]|eukprot:GSA120T00023543001.1
MADPVLNPEPPAVGTVEEEYDALGYEQDGDALPPFASDAAKAIDKDIKASESEMGTLDFHIGENAERVKVMAEHLQNVQQEVTLTQQLVDARRREMETEDHLRQLTVRQVGRLEGECVRLKRVVEDYKDRANTIQTDIFKGNEKLDQFKLEMNWNQEELEQWALAARQKEEDEIALERYRRQDDQKIRELTLEIEKLTLENNGKKAAVEEEVTTTQSQQIEMDKIAEEFKRLHEERQRLIQQWEQTVQSMKSQDERLNKLGEEYAVQKNIERGKEQKLKEKESFLAEVQSENQKVTTVIAASDRQLIRVRQDHVSIKDGLGDFHDEVEVLKGQLSGQSSEQAQQRNKLIQLKEVVEEKKVRLQFVTKKLAQTQKNLEDEKDKSKLREMDVATADKLYKEEIQILAKAEQDLKLVKEDMFKQTEDLRQIEYDEKNAHGEISSAFAAVKNLSSQIAKLDAERQRQQELLYAVDFQCQLMQRKVANVSGDGPQVGNEELYAKIASLEEQLEEQKQLEQLLIAQVRKQGLDLVQAERIVGRTEEESKKVEGTMNELALETEAVERAVGDAIRQKEEVLVERDLAKLEAKRIRGTLNTKSERVFTLENRKEQLAISMIEREKEVECHQEVLKSKLRVAEEDRHKSALELAERSAKIHNLKMKYESVKNKMQNEGGHSQAYYVLKAAQAREELQRKGDELDANIKKAEKEVRALENTLAHLTHRNDAYKNKFRTADQASAADTDQKQVLEEQNQAANDILYKKKKQLSLVEKDHGEDTMRLEEVQRQGERLDHDIRSLMQTKDELDGQLSTLQEELKQTGEPPVVPLKQANAAFLRVFRAALTEAPQAGELVPAFEDICRQLGIAAG